MQRLPNAEHVWVTLALGSDRRRHRAGADTLVRAAAYLRAHQPCGRLFNEMGYGSYLDWALYPDMQVFIDPRVELYGPTLWLDHLAISEARDYNALLAHKYGVTRVLVDRSAQPRLAAALAEWKQRPTLPEPIVVPASWC
jgi:hypothetical protein